MTVIGKGLIGQAFKSYSDQDGIVIFASGVANSGQTDPCQFKREESLLKQIICSYSNTLFVYFSTCSIEDNVLLHTPYVQHKLRMESIVCQCSKYIIFRLPQLVGISQNTTTLINFLFSKIINHEKITVWTKAERYIIDVEDVVKIASYIIERDIYSNKIINVVLNKYSIFEIIKTIEEQLVGIQAIVEFIHKGSSYEIDSSLIEPIIMELDISKDQSYLYKTINKYGNNLIKLLQSVK